MTLFGEDENDCLLIPDRVQMADQSNDNIKVQLREPLLLGLFMRAWVRDYLQEQEWPRVRGSRQDGVMAHGSLKSGTLGMICRELSRLQILPS